MWNSLALMTELHSQMANHFCELSLNGDGRNQPKKICHVREIEEKERKGRGIKKDQRVTAVLGSNTEEGHINILFNYDFICPCLRLKSF